MIAAELAAVAACQISGGPGPQLFFLLCVFVLFPLEKDVYLGFVSDYVFLPFILMLYYFSVFGMQMVYSSVNLFHFD